MLIVPLGMEGGAVFRLPLVSVLVGVACLAAFLLTGSMREEAQQIDKELGPALSYWIERPYLELPVEIEKQFVAKAMREEAKRRFVKLEGQTNRVSQFVESVAYYRKLFFRSVPPPAARKLQSEQKELNTLIGEVLPRLETQRLNQWGLVPSHGLHQAGWVTYIFFHASWIHLVLSLFLFALVAPLLEDVWGRILFLYFVIAGSAAGAVAHYFAEANSVYPLIGATGLVAACLGAFSVRFANENVQFLVFPALPWLKLVKLVRLPAWLWGILSLAVLLLAFGLLGESSGVSYMAHVGGFAAGGAIAIALQVTGFEQRFIKPNVEKTHDGWTEHRGLAAAQGAMGRGEWGEVQRQLNMVIRDQPENFEAHAGLARMAAEKKKTQEVTRHVDRMLARSIGDKCDEAVVAVIKEFWPNLELSSLRPAVALRAARIVKAEEPGKYEHLLAAVGEGEGPVAARAQLELANTYLQVKDHHRALPLLRALIDRPDANPETIALAQKRMEHVKEMLGPELTADGDVGIELGDIRESERPPSLVPASESAAPAARTRERRLSHAPGMVEFDLDDELVPERLVVTCSFAGRDERDFVAVNSKGKRRRVLSSEIAEVKVGVIGEFETAQGMQRNVLVIDLLLQVRRPTGEEVVLRFVGSALGLEHLYQAGADPKAALHALLTELASEGARIAPGNEVLAQNYPRFNDLAEFDAVRTG